MKKLKKFLSGCFNILVIAVFALPILIISVTFLTIIKYIDYITNKLEKDND
jgi:hypothetical protein